MKTSNLVALLAAAILSTVEFIAIDYLFAQPANSYAKHSAVLTQRHS